MSVVLSQNTGLPLSICNIITSYSEIDVDGEFSIRLAMPARKSELVEEVLHPIRRYIEKQYQELPWPKHVMQIGMLSEIHGGRGDYAAAAKAISLMLQVHPSAHIDWVAVEPDPDKALTRTEALSFLTPLEREHVHFRSEVETPSQNSPLDFLIIGPVPCSDIENAVQRKIDGPVYGFQEIHGHESDYADVVQCTKGPDSDAFIQEYFKMHPCFFSINGRSPTYQLPMGLYKGGGVFLDQSRMKAPLSHTFSDLSYLSLIKDVELRKDIFNSIDPVESWDKSASKVSFNSGYAHLLTSHGRFIETVARQEKEKNIVVVLNQKNFEGEISTDRYIDTIFTRERLELFRKLGYGSVTLKAGQTAEKCLLLSEDSVEMRNLTIVLRSFIQPSDFKHIQLASERLLATGDNSAIEAWCARCKLYQYEEFSHKKEFYSQQLKVADKVAPVLSRFFRYKGRQDDPAWQKILDDPQFAEDALRFCLHLTEHYAFDPAFKGGIKRTIWHHIIPELATIEAESLEPALREDIMKYLKDPASISSVTLTDLSKLKERVKEKVQSIYE